jgi:hypothetical protein
MSTSTLARVFGIALLAACVLAGLVSAVKAVDNSTTREAPAIAASIRAGRPPSPAGTVRST